MKDQLISWAISALVGSIAAWIVAKLATQLPAIEKKLDAVDDWVSAKLHITFSDSAKQSFHDVVHGACAYVNGLALNPQLWREVLRSIAAGDASKAVTLNKEIGRLGMLVESGAAISAVEGAMSSELKEVYNAAKEEIAVKVVKANLVPAGVIVGEPQIRECIKAVAPAHKPADEGPVTQSTLERMIFESQARKTALSR